MQAIGLVTDVGFFLERLESELARGRHEPRARRSVHGGCRRARPWSLPGLRRRRSAAAGRPAAGSGRRPSPASRASTPSRPPTPTTSCCPTGFTYDVVLKWGDPFTASGEPLRLQQRLHRRLPPGGRRGGAARGQPRVHQPRLRGRRRALLRRPSRCCAGRAPTVRRLQARRRGLRGARAARRGHAGPGCPCSRDPLNRRIDAFTPCRVDGPAAPLIGGEPHRGDVRQLRGRRSRRGAPRSPARRTSRPACRRWWTRGAASRAAAASTCRAATTAGWSRWIPTIPASTPVKHTALGRFRHENVGLRAEAGPARWPATWATTASAATCGSSSPTASYRPATRERTARSSPSGTLYAARFNDGRHGRVAPARPLARRSIPNPERARPEAVDPAAARGGSATATRAWAPSLHGRLPGGQRHRGHALGPSRGRSRCIPTDGSVFIAFTALRRPARAVGEHLRPGLAARGGRRRPARARASAGRASPSGGPADPAPRRPRVRAAGQPGVRPPRRPLGGHRHRGRRRSTSARTTRVFKNAGVFRVPVDGPGARRALAVRVRCPARRRPRARPSRPGSRRCSCPCSTRASATARAFDALGRPARQQLAAPPAGRAAAARGRRHPPPLTRPGRRHASCKPIGRGAAR